MTTRITFQGEQGAYSEQAIFKQFGRDCEPVPCHDLNEVFEQVESGEASYGMAPVENTMAGSINKTYDLLLDHDLQIYGEVYLPIRHCLIARPGTEIDEIEHVYSHPQALAQCEVFLKDLGVKMQPTYDTAGAARQVKESEAHDTAAIASEVAAEELGLEILADGIETKRNNTTRFVIISPEPASHEPDVEYKTSLVFEARDIPAALYKCLGGFATNDVNLSKLESRPLRDENWKYMFYLDFIGHVEDENVKQALDELYHFTVSCKIISSYPVGERMSNKK